MTLPDARANKNLEGPGFRARVQKFGGYLAGMIMPNIGAFIAWGLITALFIPKGWLPNETLGQLVDPMILYLLPILIGYTGGRMVHGQRGAVIGAIATVGVIVGIDIPMFLGAMIIGPLSAFVLRLSDKALEGKVKPGFEMLVDNFSLGIIGMLMAILGRLAIGPFVAGIVAFLSAGVNILVNAGLLPLASIFVEPGKVLFLNNAINHGIFTPLATIDVQQAGKSILFMVESNPGAGLGLLTALMLFGPRALRASAPGAMVIHFLGGIHEIYFPYILAKPVLIVAMMAGSASGLFVGTALGAGLVASPAPGSIFAYFLVTPPGGHVAMIATVGTAAVVSFVVASAVLKFGRGADASAEQAQAADVVSGMDAELLGEPGMTHPVGLGGTAGIDGADVRKVIIACDAGMGSSVMVASQMKKRLAPYGIEVTHTPVDQIPADAQVVLTQEGLADRARKTSPKAVVVPFVNYMGDPAFDSVERAVKENLRLGKAGAGPRPPPPSPRQRRPTPAPAAAEAQEDAVARRPAPRGRAPGPERRRQGRGHPPRRSDPDRHRGGRRRLRSGHAGSRTPGVHVHGQRRGDPARHQRVARAHQEGGPGVPAVPRRRRLERQDGLRRHPDRVEQRRARRHPVGPRGRPGRQVQGRAPAHDHQC